MDNQTIELIKQQSIIETARLLNIEVKRKMSMCYTGHDKNPSLSFNEKDGYFKCFGCDAKGDIIKLVMNVKGLSFPDACDWLLFAFNLSVSKAPIKTITRSSNVPNRKVDISLEKYNQPNQQIYRWVKESLDLSEGAADYLIKERGFSSECIRDLEIRDIPHPRVFFSKLKAKFDVQDLLNCGLLRQDEGRIKDIWWDYVIIFPFHDSIGNISYIQGRRQVSGSNKYINLNNVKPGVYNSRVLDTMKNNDTLFICEGVPDTITAMMMGHKAIGILGSTNFNSALVESLLQYRIYVIPDVDNGGTTFLKSVRSAFSARGKSVQKIQIPSPYNDLNEYYIKTNHEL